MACSVPYRSTMPLAGLGAQRVANPNFGSTKVVRVGPIAQQIIEWRKKGFKPDFVLHQIMADLHAQGHRQVTPEIRDQLEAGFQRFPGTPGLGSLGFAASGVVKAVSTAATVAPAAGSAIGLGATIGGVALPVVGAVIGAVVGAAILLTRRHVGKAEASWRNPGFYNSLATTAGRDYDEHQFSEAFKGMLDTGNNIVPGCGPDRHKNPDCLLGPMAGVIAQGYLSGAIPLTATTQQVFDTAVQPWLQSGAGGLVNWGTLAREPIQLSMMRAAADRYLAGQAMTRGDMPSYGNQGTHTPTLVAALQSMLNPSAPPVAPPLPAGGVPYTGQPIMAQPLPQASSVVAQVQGIPLTAPQAQAYSQQIAQLQSQGVDTSSAQVQQAVAQQVESKPVQAGFGGGLPLWATIGIAVVGLGFVFARPVKRKR